MEEFLVTFTLPLYFALSGLKTDVTTISTSEEGGITVLVCLMATVGKILGAGIPASFSGLSTRESGCVAVLMNTRGLVELIVLNLGLSSGILNIKTFSVMVIMCLFTTFITCPLVDIIYPKSIRTRVVNDEDFNKKTDDIDARLSDIAEKTFTTGGHRISVVVDTLPQMQYLVKLLNYFTPHALNAELAVTAVRFIEPTSTNKDEFLALNRDGKLIRIDEEATDIETALKDLADPNAKDPELLPLTTYCRAMNMSVNAFRVQGDPDEFPIILKNLCRENDCSMALFPWRGNNFYNEKLFWSTLHISNVPIAVVVHLDGTIKPKDRDGNPTDLRLRADSNNSTSSRDQHPLQRARGNSLFITPSFTVDSDKDVNDLSAEGSHTAASGRGNIIKLQVRPRSTSKIVALITGRYMDIRLFSLLTRFVEAPLVELKLLLPQDHELFSEDLKKTISDFRKNTLGLGNVDVVVLDAISSDHEKLFVESTDFPFDLFACSFVEPISVAENRRRSESGDTETGAGVHPVVPMTRAHRTSSIGYIADTIFQRGHPDYVEERLLAGMPSQYAFSQLAHPELGIIGNKLLTLAQKKSSLAIILHGPERLLTAKFQSMKIGGAEYHSLGVEVDSGENVEKEAEEKQAFTPAEESTPDDVDLRLNEPTDI